MTDRQEQNLCQSPRLTFWQSPSVHFLCRFSLSIAQSEVIFNCSICKDTFFSFFVNQCMIEEFENCGKFSIFARLNNFDETI